MMINFTETEMKVLRIALVKAAENHSQSYISSCCGNRVLISMVAKVDAVLKPAEKAK